MARRRKLQQLLVLSATVIALMLLANALRSLPLSPGRSLRLDFSWLRRFDTYEGQVNAEWLFVAIRLLVIIAFALFPIAVVVALLDPALRRRVLRGLLMLGLLLLAIQALQNLEWEAQEIEIPEDAAGEEEVLTEGWTPPPEVFTAPDSWIVGVVSFGIAVLLLAAIGGIGWLLWRRDREAAPLPLLAREAEIALDALYEGGELREIIIRCYAEMERVVAATRGLRRQGAMTAREFEAQLLRLGLPPAPVDGLVQVFEAARYGMRTPATAEQERAIASLEAIIAACGADQ